jgi:hypothetical protein
MRRRPTNINPDCLSEDSDAAEDLRQSHETNAPLCVRPDVLAADRGVGGYDIDTFEVSNACTSALPRTRNVWSLASAETKVSMCSSDDAFCLILN